MEESGGWIKAVSEIAHELKTPLTSALGYIDLLRNGGDPMTQRQERFVDRTAEALERMDQLVAGLLEMAWIDGDRSLDIGECDLTAAIERSVSAVRGYAERHGISLHAVVAPDLGSVQADEHRIDQVLINLLTNAVKYNHPDGDVWINATGTLASVEVSVSDTGLGIPAEDLPRIFERLYRARTVRKIDGTGLGLYIVRALVEKHGGRVWVVSEPGVGSTFTFMLPRIPPVIEGRDITQEASSLSLPLERIESDDFGGEYSSEELNSVDDNLQEPPQLLMDEDEPDIAEQS